MLKFIVKIFFNIYIQWGSLIRFFQKKRRNYYQNRLNLIKEFALLKTIDAKWQRVLSKMRYRPDPAWQLWDAVTDPWCSLLDGGDDCDGYASIATRIFGLTFKHKKDTFNFKGLIFGIYKNKESGKLGGHCIAVWENQNLTSNVGFFVISTQRYEFYKNFVNVLDDCFSGELLGYVDCGVKSEIDFNMFIKNIVIY
jgi:hypothetical protein